jgi:hypothetical protein
MTGDLTRRLSRLEARQAPAQGKVYRVIIDEAPDEEARHAAIRDQLAGQGIMETRPEDLIIVREMISPKREGLAA